MTESPLSPRTMRHLREVLCGPSQGEARYRKEAKLGEGGVGEVWRAWDGHLGRWVALKFLKGGGREERARFEREGLTAARLSHPHIVPIHDVGELEGQRFLSMEYVEGESLGAKALEPRRAATILRDVAEAVHYAHQMGIVHRDLKPQNLILDVRGHVWVTDFGLARSIVGGTTFTAPGALVGTPAYMAPEQAAGERCTERSDVHSLGATLYHLLVGEPPFRGKSALEVAHRARTEDPVAPRARNAAIPRDLEAIVLKAMEKLPSRRYATAAEFAEELERWTKGEPIQARPPSRMRRWGRAMRRHPVALALMGIGMLAAVVIAATVGQRYFEARRLGDEGVTLAGEGRWLEAKGKLEQSTALWKLDRFDRELARVNQELTARRPVDRVSGLYDDVLRRLGAEVRRAEEVALGGRSLDVGEANRLMSRVEEELKKTAVPVDSILPTVIRGWMQCNLGQEAQGERDLEEATAKGRGQADPCGLAFHLRWKVRKAYRSMDPATRRSFPTALVQELVRVSKDLAARLPSPPPPNPPGGHYRRFVHALAAAAANDRTKTIAEIEALSMAPELQAEARFVLGIVLFASGDPASAASLFEQAVRVRTGSLVDERWLAESKR